MLYGIFILIGMLWQMMAMGMSISSTDATLVVDLVKFVMISVFINSVMEMNISSSVGVFSMLLISMSVTNFLMSLLAIALEILSMGFSSMSLSFSMLANMAAGHILGDLIISAKFLSMKSVFSLVGFSLMQLVHFTYELLVALIQMLIFTTLVAVYAEMM